MADKIRIKTAVIIFLCFGIFISLSACMAPVDMDSFFKSEDVGNYITTVNKPSVPTQPTPPVEVPKVKVDDKTGDGLKGGDGKIEGLKPNRYYMVEKEVDEDGNPVDEDSYPNFVTDYPEVGPGGLWGDLGLITIIKDGSINKDLNVNDLTNLHTYTVRAAEPFQNGLLKYKDDLGEVYKQIKSGVLDISGIKGTGYIDLSSVFLDGSYEVIAVSADNSPNSWTWASKTISSWSSFKLEGANTEIDYVFVKGNDPSEFKVLRVKIGPTVINIAAIQGVTPPVTGATPVTTITESTQYTGTVSWNDNPSTFAGSTVYTATITLTAKQGYTLQGVGANFFSVAGTSTSATNAADSGVITAVFPATQTAPSGIKVTITFTVAETIVNSSSASVSISTLTSSSAALTLTSSGVTLSDIKWYCDGEELTGKTAMTLTLGNTDNSSVSKHYLMLGKHIFTVVGKAGNIVYSASFTLTVTE